MCVGQFMNALLEPSRLGRQSPCSIPVSPRKSKKVQSQNKIPGEFKILNG